MMIALPARTNSSTAPAVPVSRAGGGRADAVVLNPQLPLVDADGDASLFFSFRTDTLTVAGEYTVCAEYVETRDHLTRARSWLTKYHKWIIQQHMLSGGLG